MKTADDNKDASIVGRELNDECPNREPHSPQSASIASWQLQEQPRYRLIHEGAEALATAELLAVCLGSGVAGEDAVAASAAMRSADSSAATARSCCTRRSMALTRSMIASRSLTSNLPPCAAEHTSAMRHTEHVISPPTPRVLSTRERRAIVGSVTANAAERRGRSQGERSHARRHHALSMYRKPRRRRRDARAALTIEFVGVPTQQGELESLLAHLLLITLAQALQSHHARGSVIRSRACRERSTLEVAVSRGSCPAVARLWLQPAA